MLLAVEATRLQREVRGIGRYVRALLPRLVAQRGDVRLALFVKNRIEAAALERALGQDPALSGRSEVRLVRDLKKARADVFWYPWNVARPVPKHGAVVPTIHDVAQVALPDPRWTAWRKNFRWRRLFAATARRATLIVADSAFTGREIQRTLGVPPERIRVVPLAVDDAPVTPADGDAAALERLGVRGRFVLAVGADERRKNLALVGRAMATLAAGREPVTLVLAGPRRKRAQPEWTRAPWVRTLGFVTDEELTALYRNAVALVQPSTYEGFGFPPLEAMRLGTPVVSTRCSSLPEVVGDAADYVDPHDDLELSAALLRLLSDATHRADMASAGRSRAALFTWSETARLTLQAFDEARALA